MRCPCVIYAIPMAIAFLLAGCSMTDHSAECDKLLVSAQNKHEIGDNKEAAVLLEKAKNEASQSPYAWQRERVLREQAKLCLEMGDAAKAEELAKTLVAAYDSKSTDNMVGSKRSDLAADRSTARSILGDALTKQHKYDEAITVLNAARDELSRESGDVGLEAVLDHQYYQALHESGNKTADKVDMESATEAMSEARMNVVESERHIKQRDKAAAIDCLKSAQKSAISSHSSDWFVMVTTRLVLAYYIFQDNTAARAELQKVQSAVTDKDTTKEHAAQYYAVCALLAPTKDECDKFLAQGETLSPNTPQHYVSTIHYLQPLLRLSEVKYFSSTLPVEFNGMRVLLLHSLYETIRVNPEQKKEALEWYENLANDGSANIEERDVAAMYAAKILVADHSPAAKTWNSIGKKLDKLAKQQYPTLHGKHDDGASANKSEDKAESPGDGASAGKSEDKLESPGGTGKEADAF